MGEVPGADEPKPPHLTQPLINAVVAATSAVVILDDLDISMYPTPEAFRDVVCSVYNRDPVLFTLELTTLRTL